jgi:hypothetical protein
MCYNNYSKGGVKMKYGLIVIGIIILGLLAMAIPMLKK